MRVLRSLSRTARCLMWSPVCAVSGAGWFLEISRWSCNLLPGPNFLFETSWEAIKNHQAGEKSRIPVFENFEPRSDPKWAYMIQPGEYWRIIEDLMKWCWIGLTGSSKTASQPVAAAAWHPEVGRSYQGVRVMHGVRQGDPRLMPSMHSTRPVKGIQSDQSDVSKWSNTSTHHWAWDALGHWTGCFGSSLLSTCSSQPWKVQANEGGEDGAWVIKWLWCYRIPKQRVLDGFF